MSDRELTQLLDRAVHHAPQMHLSGEAMLAAGKGRVRRRRAVGVGGALGAAALVAAVWGGLTGAGGTTLGPPDLQPATTVWEQGEVVDGTLFSGFQTIDDDQVAHSYEARLTRQPGEGPTTLVLSDNGAVVEEIRAHFPVPGLEVFAGDRMTVAVWAEPEGVSTSVPLVGPRDPGGPSGVQRAEVSGRKLAYAVWAGDVVDQPEEVLDVYLIGRDGATALSGTQLQWVSFGMSGHRARAFADASRGVVGYAAPDQEIMLAQLGDRPAQISSSGAVVEDGVETTVTVLPAGAEVEGLAGETNGTDWGGTRVLDREVVMVVRDLDASTGAPPVLTFTLGGRTYDLDSYVQDLHELDLSDGSTLLVDVGADGASQLTLDGEGGPSVSLELAEPDRDGTATAEVGGSMVTAVTGWDTGAHVLADARVEVTDRGVARWLEPTDVAQVELGDGRLVTVLATEAGDDLEVTGIGLQIGNAVQRWVPEES